MGDFEGALTSNGFLKIQERGGVDLPKMPSVLPVSVGDWLEYEAAVLTKLKLGERWMTWSTPSLRCVVFCCLFLSFATHVL